MGKMSSVYHEVLREEYECVTRAYTMLWSMIENIRISRTMKVSWKKGEHIRNHEYTCWSNPSFVEDLKGWGSKEIRCTIVRKTSCSFTFGSFES